MKRLMKSKDRKIFGVCGGIAEYFDIDPTIVRVVYLAATFFSACFPGFVLYLILGIVMPQSE